MCHLIVGLEIALTVALFLVIAFLVCIIISAVKGHL